MTTRDAELRELERAFSLGRAGDGTVVLLSGSAGMGKTALVGTFLDHLAKFDPIILTASCSFAERELPLGMIRQLFGSPRLPPDCRAAAAELLSGHLGSAHRSDGGDSAGDTINAWQAEVAQGLLEILLDLASGRCVVLAVHDFEHVDACSMHILMYLLVRIGTARVVTVLNESTDARPRFPALRAEILRQPHARQIRLLPLTRDGVVTMVGESLGEAAADRLTTSLHELSGGNPLLLRALIDDCTRVALDGELESVEPGVAFAEAFTLCLSRHGDEAVRAARTLALLDDAPRTEMLARVLGTSPEAAAQLLDRLNDAGLLSGRRFRHPVARAALLHDVPADELTGLREHVAQVLHHSGAPVSAVLAQLLASGRPAPPWAADPLRREARRAMDAGRYETALSCLDLVGDQSFSPRDRAEVDALRSLAEWRLHPAEVTHRFPDLTGAVRQGHLPDREAVAVIRNLLWYGHYETASGAIQALADRDPGRPEHAAFLSWLACTYPTLMPGTPVVRPVEPLNPELRAAILLGDLLLGKPVPEAALEADYLLRISPPADGAHYPLVSAVEALVYAGDLEGAERWCATLMQSAIRVRSSIGMATLSSLRAGVALRRGDLPAVVRHAGFALDALSPSGWGVGLGAPLHCLIAAHTAMGELDEAARLVQQVLPRGAAETRFGLLYWHARGHYYLAAGQVHAAIEDFQVCGETMRRWGLDQPALVPWRTDLAQSLLRAGKADRAAALAEAQLDLTGPGGGAARGVALRVLAAAAPSPRRALALLSEAVEVLEKAGDAVELARALNELSETNYVLGKASRSRVLARRARRIAETSRLRLGGRSALGEVHQPAGPGFQAVPVNDDTHSLTDAERRVAVLAAQGYTNREVGQKLFVSISTVEQHLSRVYRKLQVKRRAELATRLQPAPARITGVRATG